ncbi:ATP-binding protein [Sphingomonas ginkgonis]|uniref:ATP-binding protein n=1 Tax=Sphingomonas ginkgonis TaxID=2315330 RepID=UPI001C8CE0A1|nr:ATP-binding protein [Sphingomonas ginkgonis]
MTQFAAERFNNAGDPDSNVETPPLAAAPVAEDILPMARPAEPGTALASLARMGESRLDRIYTAFDVSQPVGEPGDLRGREDEVEALLSGVLYRRNHGIVSGPRGSGKTSLVRVFGMYADQQGIVVLYSACDDGTTFGQLMRSYLEQIPFSSVDADAVKAFEQRVLEFDTDSTPHQAVTIMSMVRYSQVIVVLDEFDRISDPDLHWKLSSLFKLISDARLPVRFVLVGGRSVFADVVQGHPSLIRHVTRVSTSPLTAESIDALLDQCSSRCGMSFDQDARTMLERVSCGSPYHARLFGMHSAICADQQGDTVITEVHVISGLRQAFVEWASFNEEDAAIFRALAAGRSGNPGPYVKVARRLAFGGEADHVDGRDHTLPTIEPGLVEGFGKALVIDGESVSFRDSTAPEFFIALVELVHRDTLKERPARKDRQNV